MLKIVAALSLLTLSACSYNASVQSTSTAASEIRLDRQRTGLVAVVIENEIQNLIKEVDPSTFVCTAHDYPLEIGTALRQSIYEVLESAYSSIDLVDRIDKTNGAFHTYLFSLESFDPELHFNMGFWSGKASSSVDITLDVAVYDENSDFLFKTTISGDGSAGPMSGGCGDGAKVLADASRDAIEDMLETFVHKVINSDQLTTTKSTRMTTHSPPPQSQQYASRTSPGVGSQLRAVSGDHKDDCEFITSITRGAGGLGDASKFIERAMSSALTEATNNGADSYYIVNSDTTASGATVTLEALNCN